MTQTTRSFTRPSRGDEVVYVHPSGARLAAEVVHVSAKRWVAGLVLLSSRRGVLRVPFDPDGKPGTWCFP